MEKRPIKIVDMHVLRVCQKRIVESVQIVTPASASLGCVRRSAVKTVCGMARKQQWTVVVRIAHLAQTVCLAKELVTAQVVSVPTSDVRHRPAKTAS